MSLDLGIFAYDFMQRAVLAGAVVAILAGLLGVFLVLRQMSLLGDGLAHLSFAGVAVGLAAGFYPVAVALVFAVAGAIAVHVLRERRVVQGDTAIGILLNAGLAVGIVVVSASRGFGAAIDGILFGNILAIEDQDLRVVVAVGVALVVLLALFYKEFFAMTFSEEAARVTGLPVGLLNTLFMSLTAATIVVASRVVGVLLVSALLIVPAAAALQLARSFRVALLLSVTVSLASVLGGIVLSAANGWAPGGSIALVAVAFFVLAVAGKRLRRPVRPTPPTMHPH